MSCKDNPLEKRKSEMLGKEKKTKEGGLWCHLHQKIKKKEKYYIKVSRHLGHEDRTTHHHPQVNLSGCENMTYQVD